MIQVWGMTDIGLVRKENQDAYAVRQENGYTIAVVCDGMGGVAGGRLASSVAVKAFCAELEQLLVSAEMSEEQLKEASERAVYAANRAITRAAEKNDAYCSMGTTLVSAVTYGGDAVVLTNIGDSRAYHVAPDGITRITKDHSLVAHMVELGDITAEEARHHPNRNLITRALGADSDAECDKYTCSLHKGEYILLCTDGLTGTVTDQELLFEIIHGGEPDTCLVRLLNIARSQGAPDNVTAVLLRKL